MKVYRCDICGEYVDDYKHINKGGHANIRLKLKSSKASSSCDICDTCYDFLEAYTKWSQETRKDIYNYVIQMQTSQVRKLINEEAKKQNKIKIKPTKQTKKLNEKEN